jgi:hypothetical protein
MHKLDRLPGFLSSRPNWLPPPPLPLASVTPPPPCSKGEHARLREGREGANVDEGTDTLAL